MTVFEPMGFPKTLWVHKKLSTGTEIYFISEEAPTEEVYIYLYVTKAGQIIRLFEDEIKEFFYVIEKWIKNKENYEDDEPLMFEFDDYAVLVFHDDGASLLANENGLNDHVFTSDIQLSHLDLQEITSMADEFFAVMINEF